MDKRIHFGWFVAWGRINLRLSQQEFGNKIGMSGRNVSRIEGMAEPSSYASSMAAIAKVLGYAPEEFDQVWRSTPVSQPKERKIDPLGRLAQTFEKFTNRPLDEQEQVIDKLSPEAVSVLRKLLIVARGQGVTVEDRRQE